MIINGEKMAEVAAGTVTDVLGRLELNVARVVVEVNGEIIPKGQYGTYWIDEAAAVEIVSFVGGG